MASGKSLCCKVILLDDQVPEFHLNVSTRGIFTAVFTLLNRRLAAAHVHSFCL